MNPEPLMPPMHADTIRACGVGFGAHHFLHAHMGARPVVVIESTLEVTCACCGHPIEAGERVLRFSYGNEPTATTVNYLHPKHCSRAGAPAPMPEIVASRVATPAAAAA